MLAGEAQCKRQPPMRNAWGAGEGVLDVDLQLPVDVNLLCAPPGGAGEGCWGLAGEAQCKRQPPMRAARRRLGGSWLGAGR